MATTVVTTAPLHTERPRRIVYMGLGGLMALMAVVGFWPRYFGPLVTGSLSTPVLIHIHATVFTGWLVLFFAQAYFAATKRIHLHLKVGTVGIWYGVLLIFVGLRTGVIRAAEHIPDGDGTAAQLLFAATSDMAMFAGFFGAAIWYRKKPKLHRPAMVVAATSLLIAAVARMVFVPANPHLRLLVWSCPVLLAMGIEYRKTGKVHPIYLLGLAVFVLRRYSPPIVTQTAAWAGFADWVFGFLT